MDIDIREETPDDVAAIETLTEAAFGQRQEANIVAALRQNGGIILSLVATRDGEVVGHVMYSRMTIAGDLEGAALGPMAVSPQFQQQGIGSRLVRAGNEWLKKARAFRTSLCLAMRSITPALASCRPAHMALPASGTFQATSS